MTKMPESRCQENEAASAMRRRAKLETEPNPDLSVDYLSVLRGKASSAGTTVTLRYVPDKLTLPTEAFAAYLTTFEGLMTESLEALALAALGDINNEVVPRWVQIVATRTDAGTADHQVIVEDRQPKWDNAALLARLERY